MNLSQFATAIPPQIFTSIQSLGFDLENWGKNPRIGGVLSKTVLSGGKRLRPLLTFLMGDLFDISHPKLGRFAKIVEMVHASTLAHDDVIDNADVRRGNPSINMISSNKKAVLAGDYLLAYCLMEASDAGRTDIVKELAAVIGDLAEGEWLQLENTENAALTRDDVKLVALKKTGSVIRWCCAVPAMLANADAETVAMSRQLGESIGIAFQMTDDILDFKREDGAEFADLKNGVVNSVIFEALATSNQGQKILDMTQISQATLDPSKLEPAILTVRAQVQDLLQDTLQLLQQIAERIPHHENRHHQAQALEGLKSLINYLGVRI